MTPRVFPQALEAERALLGGLLSDATQIEDIAALISEEDWYNPNHAKVWRWMLSSHARGHRPDALGLVDHALSTDNHDAWGGVAYLSSLPEQCPSTANLAYYAQIIVVKSKRRRLLALSVDLERAAMDADSEDLPAITAAISAEIDRVETARSPILEVGTIVERVISNAITAREAPPAYVDTGFSMLDLALGRLRPGWLVIVAGRPGMGKTQLALQIADHHARSAEGASLFLSLEMPADELGTRLVSKVSGVLQRQVRDGVGIEYDIRRIAESISQLGGLPLWVDDTPSQTLAHMRASIRAAKRQAAQWGRRLDCVVVDYLQLATAKADSREQEVAAIARGLKAVAKTEGVLMLAACQLNRGVEGRGDKRPMLSDLRESGEVEQAADIVLAPYRPGYYSEAVPQDLAQVGILKNRHGEGTGKWVELGWERGWFVHRAPRGGYQP